MPDRRQPGSGWFILSYLLAATAGVIGVVAEPSVTVREAFTSAGLGWAIGAWSIGFLAAGLGCAGARWRAWYCAEVWAVVGLGGLFALWASLVGVAGSGTAWQAGAGFACAAAFMWGWARYRWYRLRRNANAAHALRRAVDETVGEALRRDREG